MAVGPAGSYRGLIVACNFTEFEKNVEEALEISSTEGARSQE